MEAAPDAAGEAAADGTAGSVDDGACVACAADVGKEGEGTVSEAKEGEGVVPEAGAAVAPEDSPSI